MEKKRSTRRSESGAAGLDGALKRIDRVVKNAEKTAGRASTRKGVEDLAGALAARIERVKTWVQTAGEVKEEITQIEGLAKMLESAGGGEGEGESESTRTPEPPEPTDRGAETQGDEDALTRRIRSM